MPDDHTAGVGSGDPSPVAEVADDDLAVGRIIDSISHSTFWKNSAVFVVEDDIQNGADHVDGHRGSLLIASPCARRGIIDDNYYSQLNVVRTIEQILSIAPMNQEDRAAEPMFNAFINTPDFAPYTVLPNQIPLAQGRTSITTRAGTRAFVPGSPTKLGIPPPNGRSTSSGWRGAGTAGSMTRALSRTGLTRPSSTGSIGTARTAGRCLTPVTRRFWPPARCQVITCRLATWAAEPHQQGAR